MAQRHFLEKSQNLQSQNVIWSDYKHHSTVRLFLSVLNSTITFTSKTYTGRISDNGITLQAYFLHLLSRHSNIYNSRRRGQSFS